MANGEQIVDPDGAFEGTVDGFYTLTSKTDSTPLKTVRVEKAYDLWVGSTRVTENNYHDLSEAVTGPGAKASFDPESYTLTLHNVTGINGAKNTGSDDWSVIYNYDRQRILKLRGDAQICNTGSTTIVLDTYGGLDIEGDFVIEGAGKYACYSNAPILVQGNETNFKVTTSHSNGTAIYLNIVSGEYAFKQTGGNVDIYGARAAIIAEVSNAGIEIEGGVFKAEGGIAAVGYKKTNGFTMANGEQVVEPDLIQ